MPEYELTNYWLPTEKAGENHLKFYAEYVVNMPVSNEEEKTFLEFFLLSGGKNKVRKLLSRYSYVNEIIHTLEKVSDVKMQNRLTVCYSMGAGLLGIFNEDVCDEYDEVWQEFSGKGVPENVAAEWNNTPNNLFGMLTPEEVWACPGVAEKKLFTEFFKDLTDKFTGQGFEYKGEMLNQATFYLRAWANRKSPFKKTPIEIIKEERRLNANRNRSILGI